MMEAIQSYHLTWEQWAITLLCAAMVGFSKMGVGGIGLVVVPILASVFGARASTGILLPMLCVGDLIAVARYRRHTSWPHVLRPMPWAMLGVATGAALGSLLDQQAFSSLLGLVVISMLALMSWREWRGHDKAAGQALEPSTTSRGTWLFVALLGFLAGFSTMVANAAGPVWIIYLLAMGLPKLSFVGTGAWFFALINLFKLPFHVLPAFGWGTINARSIYVDLAVLPAVPLGAVLGALLVERLGERSFRRIIQVLAVLAALKYLLW